MLSILFAASTILNIPPCPPNEKLTLLSNYYPPQYVWFSDDNGEARRIASDIEVIMKQIDPKFKISLVKPKIDKGQVATVWMRDIFQSGFSGSSKQALVLELPYSRNQGIVGNIASISSNQGISKISLKHLKDHRGNHGGNIEPLNDHVVLLGNTASSDLIQFIRNQGIEVVLIDTHWLQVGHVDELFMVLPSSDAADCPTIAYASPERALDLLDSQWRSPKFCSNQRFQALAKLGIQSQLDCEQFVLFSKAYQNIISSNIERIKSAACSTFLPLPVSFYPSSFKMPIGEISDQSRSFEPNPSNSLVLHKEVFIPKQSIVNFSKAIKRDLAKIGFNAHFIDTKLPHWNGGNIHCLSNTLRYCDPKRPR